MNWHQVESSYLPHVEACYQAQDNELYRRDDDIARTIADYNINRNIIAGRFYHRWLSSLGGLLVAWGSGLQERYDTLVSASSTKGDPTPC